MSKVIPIHLGDRVTLRKPHACGGTDWEVTRTGADVKAKCLQCGHEVMLPRVRFERSIKRFVGEESGARSQEPGDGGKTTGNGG